MYTKLMISAAIVTSTIPIPSIYVENAAMAMEPTQIQPTKENRLDHELINDIKKWSRENIPSARVQKQQLSTNVFTPGPKTANIDFIGELDEQTYKNMMYLLTQKKKTGVFYRDIEKADEYIQFVYKVSLENQINPVLLLAIQLLETEYFSSNVFKKFNNPGGLQGAISKKNIYLPEIGAVVVENNGCDAGYGYYKYNSMEEGVKHQAQIFKIYKEKGRKSLYQVGKVYNGSQQWLDDATWFLKKIQPDIHI